MNRIDDNNNERNDLFNKDGEMMERIALKMGQDKIMMKKMFIKIMILINI